MKYFDQIFIKILDLQEKGLTDASCYELIAYLQRHLSVAFKKNEFCEIDNIFIDERTSLLNDQNILGVLMITSHYKEILPSRTDFYKRIKKGFIDKHGKKYTKRLLDGLF